MVSFLFLELVSVCSLFCTLTCSDNISQPTVVAQPNVGMLVGYYGGGGGSDGGGGGVVVVMVVVVAVAVAVVVAVVVVIHLCNSCVM